MTTRALVLYTCSFFFIITYFVESISEPSFDATGQLLSQNFPRPFSPNCTFESTPVDISNFLTAEQYKEYLNWHDAIYKYADYEKIQQNFQFLNKLNVDLKSDVQRWFEIRLLIDVAFYNLQERNLSLAEVFAHQAILKSQFADPITKVDALTCLSNIQYQKLQFDKSLESVEKARSLIDNDRDFERMNELLFLKTMNYNNDNYLDSALMTINILNDRCIEDPGCSAFAHHLKGINGYFRGDENLAEKNLHSALELYNRDNCSDIYHKSRTYYELANSLQRSRDFKFAEAYYDSAIWIYNNFDLTPEKMKGSMKNITLLSGKAELLTDMAIALNSISLGEEAFLLFKEISKQISKSARYDRDSYIQNEYFHNFLYSYIIRLCAFMSKSTSNEKWIHSMVYYLARYKSASLFRDLKLNKLWKKHSKDSESSIYKFVKNDSELEQLLSREDQEVLKMESLQSKRELLETEKTLLMKMYREGLLDAATDMKIIKSSVDLDIAESNYDKTVRLYYYVGSRLYNENIMYAIYIYQGEIGFYEILESDMVIAQVDSLLQWHNNDDVKNLVSPFNYSKLSNQVYNAILEPILVDLEDVERIQILPDNILHGLSFSSLVTKTSNYDTSFCSISYLVNDVDISYKYLVQVPSICENAEAVFIPGKVATFGWSSKNTILEQPETGFRELPGSMLEQEVVQDAFSDLHSVVSYGGYKATKENFFKEMSECSILHLALHAESGLTSRLDSKLYFRRNDGVEEVLNHDLQYLQLDADLVVLSGCQTNAGKNQEAEGLFSLSRAFYKAGASKVISSMWTLDDHFAHRFFRIFYAQLKINESYVASLNAAQRIYLSNCNLGDCYPGVWAGLVLHQ